MAIGTLGPIVFQASSKKVQTFKDFSQSNSARIATHENLQNKPILEFIGPGLENIDLKLVWSVEGNINPATEVKKLEDVRDKGEVISFFLGGKPVGLGKFLIQDIQRNNARIDNQGNIFSIAFDIKLIEYHTNAKKTKKITNIQQRAVKRKAKKTSTSKKKKKFTPQKKTIGKKKVTKKKSRKHLYKHKDYMMGEIQE